jgi:hypothetical protein
MGIVGAVLNISHLACLFGRILIIRATSWDALVRLRQRSKIRSASQEKEEIRLDYIEYVLIPF